MKKNKTIGVIFVIIVLAIAGFLGFTFSKNDEASAVENKPYENYIGYIDQQKALLNTQYKLCDEGRLFNTYSGAGLKAYKGSKKRFRDRILSTFNENSYTDSGYLNFRFLVNCEGNAGWFEIIQMNLDLEETTLNSSMVDLLLNSTADADNWEVIEYYEAPRNYYMYVSYRIENGKITEIIP